MIEREALRPGSVGQLLYHLAPNLCAEQRVPPWPPDAFALGAALLYFSGSYTEIVNSWPPPLPKNLSRAEKRHLKRTEKNRRWAEFMRKLGLRWSSLATSGAGKVPKQVRDWWKAVFDSKDVLLHNLGSRSHRRTLYAIVQILAVADEACHGVGRPLLTPKKARSSTDGKSFKEMADDHLALTSGKGRSTLCLDIETPQFQVLPKHHTPQQGLTLRSLSHHLAFCPSREVSARWLNFYSPQEKVEQQGKEHSLNILLVPWPREVHPTQFSSAKPPSGRLRNMDKRYGFFRYSTRDHASEKRDLADLFAKARRKVGRIDGLIMPELALNYSRVWEVYDYLYATYFAESDGSDGPPFLVAGVTSKDEVNSAVSILTFPGQDDEDYSVTIEQPKNHRWKLTASQIAQYGLGSRLDPECDWWEQVSIRDRELWFVVLRPWLTFCTLICEDLARPDPIAEVVRAVGPNLVLALLMDGPQLLQRWPARYATVLADDPGCSVLTLTSIGMAERCLPAGKSPSRVVALWRDSYNGGTTEEIRLPPGDDGIILTLTRKWSKVWSADGRANYGRTSFIQLTNRTTISLSEES